MIMQSIIIMQPSLEPGKNLTQTRSHPGKSGDKKNTRGARVSPCALPRGGLLLVELPPGRLNRLDGPGEQGDRGGEVFQGDTGGLGALAALDAERDDTIFKAESAADHLRRRNIVFLLVLRDAVLRGIPEDLNRLPELHVRENLRPGALPLVSREGGHDNPIIVRLDPERLFDQSDGVLGGFSSEDRRHDAIPS